MHFLRLLFTKHNLANVEFSPGIAQILYFSFYFLITLHCLLTLKGVPTILTESTDSCPPCNSHTSVKRQNLSP